MSFGLSDVFRRYKSVATFQVSPVSLESSNLRAFSQRFDNVVVLTLNFQTKILRLNAPRGTDGNGESHHHCSYDH